MSTAEHQFADTYFSEMSYKTSEQEMLFTVMFVQNYASIEPKKISIIAMYQAYQIHAVQQYRELTV